MASNDLTPADLQQLSAWLDEALELGAADRERWLAGLSEHSPVMHRRLLRLLALQDQQTGPNLPGQASAADLLAAPTGAAAGLLPEQLVGPYRLESEIGRGGMAQVWRAARSDGAFQRHVALKLPQLSRLRPDLAERFSRERDILARLEHPNIARFYDAGISSDGLPYLAMEYVDGQPLTSYCDQHCLPLAARVQVFLQVLEAIRHAHANLVIHRDIKPSNVLVTAEGQVRVLDFGIAKLIDGDELSRDSELTRDAGRALTMAYASPEQLRGEPLSTATDVYSLGVVLYELLTGSRPFATAGDSAARLEVAILDTLPTRPGLALIAAADASERARRRGGSPARLARELDGDLGSVLRKALAKDPAQRYDGCAALRDDLRRVLESRPVQARSESAWYLVRRFVGRNRLAVGSIAGVLLAVLAGASAAIWQAGVAREQARRAQQQEARAVAVQDFLLGLFRANADAQPDPVRARQTTARELLDIGARRVRDQLDNAPEAKDAVLSTLSDMFVDVGLDQEAADLYGERVTLREKLYGPDDIRVAEALIDQTHAIDATPQATRGPALLERARRIVDGAPTADIPLRLRVMFAQAQVTRYTNTSASLGFVRDAATLIERSATPGDPRRRALYLEGLTLGFLGRCQEGLQRLEQAHRISQAATGPKQRWQIPENTAIFGNAMCLGDLARAETALQEALAMSQQLNGPDHVDTLHVELRLMRLYADTSRAAEAAALEARLRRRVEEPATQHDGNLNATLLRALTQRSWESGRLADAQALSERLVPTMQRFTGPSTVLAASLQAQGRILGAQGRFDEATRHLGDAEAMLRQVLGPGATAAALATVRIDRAALDVRAGRTPQALARLDEVDAALPANLPEARALRPLLARWRAAALRGASRAADAETLARGGLSALGPPWRPTDLPRLRADLLLEQGLALAALGRTSAAREALANALALRTASDDGSGVWRLEVERALAQVKGRAGA